MAEVEMAKEWVAVTISIKTKIKQWLIQKVYKQGQQASDNKGIPTAFH